MIANQIFFRLLPALIWVDFFYSLGSAGATVYFSVGFGCELFLILCEAFIAISRYLAFSSNHASHSFWSLKRLQKFLHGILAVSVLYGCAYIFCPFKTNKNAWGTGVTFNFKPNQLTWVGISILVPFVVSILSLLSCVFCYFKVATIISASQSGLNRAIVLKMCLSTLIVMLGTCLTLVVNATNHLSYVIGDFDLIPVATYLYLAKFGSIVSVCGTPWILLALFPPVRNAAFPCFRRAAPPKTIMVSTSSQRP